MFGILKTQVFDNPGTLSPCFVFVFAFPLREYVKDNQIVENFLVTQEVELLIKLCSQWSASSFPCILVNNLQVSCN